MIIFLCSFSGIGFLVCPSPDYQPDEEGLLDECGVAVRSDDRFTLVPPAAVLDSAAVTTPVLSIVETVSDDDSTYVRSLAGHRICDNTALYHLGYPCCKERRPQYSPESVQYLLCALIHLSTVSIVT